MAEPAELLAALRPIREPVLTEAEALADGVLAFGLGLLAMMLVFWMARLFLAARGDPRAQLRRALAESEALVPGERLLAQLRLARRVGGPGVAEVQGELAHDAYRPALRVDLDATHRKLAAELDRRAPFIGRAR